VDDKRVKLSVCIYTECLLERC